MTPEQVERLEVLRRIAERGRSLAQLGSFAGMPHGAASEARAEAHVSHLDLWQHMIDEIGRMPR